MNQKKVIALLGMPGSGKTEAINHLVKKHGWSKVYFGEVTFDAMKRLGLEITPANERVVREDLRAQLGKDHYAKQVIKKVHALKEDVVLVESLYSWTEYRVLKKEFGSNLITIAIHVMPQIRYERLAQRKIRPLTIEEAQTRDYAEIENIEKGGPIAMADYVIDNSGDMQEMQYRIDTIITQMRTK